MTNLLPSVMRTGVPIVYALLIKLGFSRLGVSDAVGTDVATVILAAMLYGLLRVLEELEPKLGVLLGWIGAPKYDVSGALASAESVTKVEVEIALSSAKDDIVAEVGKLIEARLSKPAAKKTAKKTAAKPAS